MPFIIPASALSQDNLDNVRIMADARVRVQRRTDKDFDSSVADNETLIEGRTKVGFEINDGINRMVVRWVIAGQDKNIDALNNNNNNDDQTLISNSHRLKFGSGKDDGKVVPYEMYVDFDAPMGRVIAGRQELKISSKRVLSSSSWSNRGRTYDALRYTSDKKVNGQPVFDAFFGQIGQASSYSKDVRLGGIGTSTGLGQSYLIYKHDNPMAGEINIFTLTHRLNRSVSENLNVELEGGYQWGDAGMRAKDAWYFHGAATYNFSDKTALTATYNAASGGGSVTKDNTFDVNYPSSHEFYGYIDMQGNSNVSFFSVALTHQFCDKFSVIGSYNNFKLRDSRDGWYKNNGSLNSFSGGNFIDPTGSSGSNVGSEFDLILEYKYDDRNTIGFGGAIFKPGSYVKSFVPNAKDQVWFYGFWNFKY